MLQVGCSRFTVVCSHPSHCNSLLAGLLSSSLPCFSLFSTPQPEGPLQKELRSYPSSIKTLRQFPMWLSRQSESLSYPQSPTWRALRCFLSFISTCCPQPQSSPAVPATRLPLRHAKTTSAAKFSFLPLFLPETHFSGTLLRYGLHLLLSCVAFTPI